MQSFPRSLWLDQNKKQLVQWPIVEIEMLHENEVGLQDKKLEGGSLHEVVGITASQADVKISFKLTDLEEPEELDESWTDPQLICSKMDASKKGKFGPFGLLALASRDLTEQTAIFFRVFQTNGRCVVLMCSDQSRSSARNGLDKTTYGAFVDIDPKQDEISLRTLVDHSIVESFGGGGKTCITSRVYPTFTVGEDAHLFAFNNGTESVVVSELNAWSVLHFDHVQSNTITLESLFGLRLEQPYRTAFHFQPPQNWMNGPMYYNGVYHNFYQHNPFGPLFGNIHWAHSVSHDLINWIPLEPALAPTDPFDINGCYSGSTIILPGNKPVMLYTGADNKSHQVQNLAVPKDLSDPYLREWVKYSGNPIINVPDGIKKDDFRDPSTAWFADDGKWRMIIGSNKDNTGIAFLYQTEDFINWTRYNSPLYKVEGTGVWECPDFFPVWVDSTNGADTSVINPSDQVKHVLKVGLLETGKDYYMIGNYIPEKELYIPQNDFTLSTLRYDYGKYYASKSFFDPLKKRRIVMAWVNESHPEADAVARGWFGIQSFPRTLWLDRNKKQLIQWPIEEIEMLYGNKIAFQNTKLEGGSLHEVVGITASQADVKISFKLTNLEEAEELDKTSIDPQLICSEKDASNKGKLGPFGLLALTSKDLTEQTAIFFRVFKSNGQYVVIMCSDQSRSSKMNGLDKTTYGGYVDIDPQQDEISLRTLIDHSVIESFGGGGKTCITARVYPTLAIGKNARLFAFNNGTESVVISELSAWSVNKARINIVEETISCPDHLSSEEGQNDAEL
ncbi:Concanavalin A-like lectin/glucanases superfamily [Artemisia annua]|uniref:Concanavalin A-like lectin/glucanases superfamily n=1 Tax=Artemisia annua TaxID=35608 RepID=A0A2U1PIZ4_ARTAN|nr:Concanavalin A-like lectin/glucanases superfamily [Artemisia annua]